MNEREKLAIKEGICQHCLYYRSMPDAEEGSCHRNPPAPLRQDAVRWHPVRWSDWCGEFVDRN